jgi:hypothetical protein
MKKSIIMILLLALTICGCDINNDNNSDDDVPPPSLPPTVYGQLPTRNAIIQAAEAVGAVNVQIISYQRATGTSENAGGVHTHGGYQPSWWRPNVTTWGSGNFFPTLTGVYVVYDETDNMHPRMSVRGALHRLFENAGFMDTWFPGPFRVETTTDKRWRLIPLPTHASIINAVEQLGASNVRIPFYVVFAAEFYFWRQPPPVLTIPGTPITLVHHRAVPVDGSFNAVQGNVGHTSPRWIWLSYDHPGLGSIITNNDVINAIRALFIQYGFEDVLAEATGTLISSSFPLPSFNQIRQAAEQAGANNVQVSTYRANNGNVIPMNEGSRLANAPIVVEINYDGPVLPAVNANVRALFANFNTVHIGNNAVATIPLPTGSNIRQAVLGALYFPANLSEPRIYTANGTAIWTTGTPGNAVWNARIVIVMDGDGTNTAADAARAVQAIINLFHGRGFFNLEVNVSNR